MEIKNGIDATDPLSIECQAQILDLSKKGLKKVPKQDDAQNVKILILDDNDLQKIDNIDSYLRIEKLSLCRNNLLRMYGVCRLHFLQELNLPNNGILTIEGLKELTQLKHLNLQNNSIKTIEHLNSNYHLEYLNLAGNSVNSIADISFLKNLRELYLNGNRISHLRQCDRYLPTGLQVLTLSHNSLTDLNEICTLSGLSSLNSISIQDNPCVQMTGNSVYIYKTSGFDYRPFVLNWCMTVKVIDGFVVNPIESLKAEWLYSQGRGRQFRVGEQVELARYLSSVCPMTGEALENEDERKLRLILSKAQQHQRQLQEEISEGVNMSATNSPSSGRRKGTSNRIQSPRVSRLGRSGSGSPDSMSSSYHGNTSTISSINNDMNTLIQMSASLMENVKSDQSIMVQSLDPTLLSNSSTKSNSSLNETTCVRSVIPQLNDHQIKQNSPLVSASKMVPVPESLMSPDCPPAGVAPVHPKIPQPSGPLQNAKPNNKSLAKPNKESKLTSPKINRPTAAKRQEKSPVLNVRKNNSINTALTTNNPANNTHHGDLMTSTPKHQKGLPPLHRASPPPPLPPALPPVHHTPPSIDNSNVASSDDDSDNINVDKLKTIHSKAAQRSLHHKEKNHPGNSTIDGNVDQSAIVIQKIWRGYKIRKQNKGIAEILQKKRTQEYIMKLTQDMETTKVALENERKIQQLQMQAINALWKKVSTMQATSNPSAAELVAATQNLTLESNSTAVVQDLAKTCSVLTNQVQQLQGSMRDILQCMTTFCKLPPQSVTDSASTSTTDVKDSSATQTEIIAVHTPQVENLPFPFNNKVVRPSTLPLVESNETSPRRVSADNVSSNKDQSPENNQKDSIDENISVNTNKSGQRNEIVASAGKNY